MAVQVSPFQDILDALEHHGIAAIRFLTTPPGQSINRIEDVIENREPWDPNPGVHDVCIGRLLTYGWIRPYGPQPALLDLRFQLEGIHEWPTAPAVGLWQRWATKIDGVLLLNGSTLERHAYAGRGENDCTTIRIAVPTARLLEGAS